LLRCQYHSTTNRKAGRRKPGWLPLSVNENVKQSKLLHCGGKYESLSNFGKMFDNINADHMHAPLHSNCISRDTFDWKFTAVC
jgi:hypothetical protein